MCIRDSYNHIQTREIEFFENHRMGETMAMLNDDVNQIERFLNTGFNEILQLGVLFAFSSVVLLGVSWQLALVGLLPLPIVLWGSLFYQKTISPRYNRVREAVGSLSSRLENNIAGILVIKSFTAEGFESQRVKAASGEYQEANRHAIRLSSVYVPMIRMAIAIGFGGVLLLGSYWVLEDKGILTVGELVLFSMLIQRMLWPLTRMGITLDEFERAKASARRTFGLLETPSKIIDPPDAQSLPKPVRGEIRFEGIRFNYRRGNTILSGLDFTLSQGETIGIAGATGAGKSTLIKILSGVFKPTDGEIIVEGRPVSFASPRDATNAGIGTVYQDLALNALTSVTRNFFLGREISDVGPPNHVCDRNGDERPCISGSRTCCGPGAPPVLALL